jgi:hypothetical protein
VVLDLKAALERLAQLWDLQTHPCFGELGELRGVGDAGQQRFEHRPRGLRVRV